ncbi:hypothetical protein NONI108955_42105 [Nocardia ninae]|uniref:YbaB/EbfC DNA-binding family protein n=1 Tax=Nocardia ninae NBRC 108245 TaxID=1210091 RepID=A0A511MCR6_9NOCA|nr:hypothetical protein [Nocardia ninae]GEM38440.1 hypothetical protein NN4_29590 [Nocardia ninae NBRC 108245]
MTDLQRWEQQLQQELAEIRRSAETLAKSAAAVTGRGELRGITIEVNAGGDITTLHIAPAAMRWSTAQLTNALLDCHRRARADVRAKTEEVARTADPRLRSQLQEILGTTENPPAEQRRTLTEEQVQAADDAYFERINQGWTTER